MFRCEMTVNVAKIMKSPIIIRKLWEVECGFVLTNVSLLDIICCVSQMETEN